VGRLVAWNHPRFEADVCEFRFIEPITLPVAADLLAEHRQQYFTGEAESQVVHLLRPWPLAPLNRLLEGVRLPTLVRTDRRQKCGSR